MMAQNRQGRLVETRRGHFRIAVWQCRRLRKARHDFDVERTVEFERASIRHSRFNPYTNRWENQVLWCGADDLRDLVQALDDLNEAD